MDALTAALARARRHRTLAPPAMRRLLRLTAGLTQLEIGQALGVSAVSVCRYETGAREPKGEIRDKYLAVLERLAHEKVPA